MLQNDDLESAADEGLATALVEVGFQDQTALLARAVLRSRDALARDGLLGTRSNTETWSSARLDLLPAPEPPPQTVLPDLDEEDQLLVKLRFQENLSWKGVAEALGLSVSAVWARWRRLRTRLEKDQEL